MPGPIPTTTMNMIEENINSKPAGFGYLLPFRRISATIPTTIANSNVKVKIQPLLPILLIASSNSSKVNVSRSEEHTSELQSRFDLVCRLLLEKKKNINHRKNQNKYTP